jgi:hypothetical protein
MEGKILSETIEHPKEGLEVFYVGEYSPAPFTEYPFRKYRIKKVFQPYKLSDLEILKKELGYPSVLFSIEQGDLKQLVIEYKEDGYTKKLPIHHEQENMAMMLKDERVKFRVLYRTTVGNNIAYYENSNGQMELVAKIELSEL